LYTCTFLSAKKRKPKPRPAKAPREEEEEEEDAEDTEDVEDAEEFTIPKLSFSRVPVDSAVIELHDCSQPDELITRLVSFPRPRDSNKNHTFLPHVSHSHLLSNVMG
jgi:hypothetical protein